MRDDDTLLYCTGRRGVPPRASPPSLVSHSSCLAVKWWCCYLVDGTAQSGRRTVHVYTLRYVGPFSRAGTGGRYLVHRQSAMGNAQIPRRPIKPIQMCMSSDLRLPRPLAQTVARLSAYQHLTMAPFRNPWGGSDEGGRGHRPFVRCKARKE